jgi:hypothetical protein
MQEARGSSPLSSTGQRHKSRFSSRAASRSGSHPADSSAVHQPVGAATISGPGRKSWASRSASARASGARLTRTHGRSPADYAHPMAAIADVVYQVGKSVGLRRAQTGPYGVRTTSRSRIADVVQTHTHAQIGILHRALDGYDDCRAHLRHFVIRRAERRLFVAGWPLVETRGRGRGSRGTVRPCWGSA